MAMRDQDRVPRGAANARERTRMRVLSKAFGRLKLTLPWVPPDTKLSKLDTLRLATSYIAHLKRIVTDSEDEEGGGNAAAEGEAAEKRAEDGVEAAVVATKVNMVRETLFRALFLEMDWKLVSSS